MWKVNGRWTPSDGKSSHCLWQGERKMNTGYKFLRKKISKKSAYILSTWYSVLRLN
jgi:hypothetical protein